MYMGPYRPFVACLPNVSYVSVYVHNVQCRDKNPYT